MEYNLGTLIQQKEMVDRQRNNNPKVYEEAEIDYICCQFSDFLENAIKLQEGK